MIPYNWAPCKRNPIFTSNNGVLEDFVVIPSGNMFAAYYCKGNDFSHLSLYRSVSDEITGEYKKEELIERGIHIRLYRGKVNDTTRLITAIRPGLPHGGIWVFRDAPFGMIKSVLIEPKYGSLYSVVAGNPCVIWDGTEYNIFFEGRNDTVYWRLFQAVWDGMDGVRVIDTPLFDGANPSILKHDGKYYLFYSKYRTGGEGFETWCMEQKA